MESRDFGSWRELENCISAWGFDKFIEDA